jgi:aryl-alcohol dehydrogenase-like predicted oxidoreductase
MESTSSRVLENETAGTLAIGDRRVRRMGFGAMRISGARNAEGARDRAVAVELVQGVQARGVQFFDTANIYGYGQSEEIIAEALAPYADDLLIATKAGFRPGKLAPGQASLPPLGRPEHIREECEQSLRRLAVECLELYIVHVPDPEVPWADTVGAFAELQQAGKVRHIGISNVTLDQLRAAQEIVAVVSVENRYSVGDRTSEPVLAACEEEGIAFLPYSPLKDPEGPVGAALADIATSRGVLLQQVSLAWLLQRSPVMLPIPGTSQLVHASENIDAAWLELSPDEMARLDVGRPTE